MHKKKKRLIRYGSSFFYGGAYWTRTSDPIDVNDVLWHGG